MSNKQKEVVIVGAARTPIGKHGGYYNEIPAEDIAALAMEEAILRSKIDLSQIKIDQVVAAMIYVDSRCQQIYLPRNVALKVAAKLGDTDNLAVAPGKSTLRLCGTGFQVLADSFDLLTAQEPHKMNCTIAFATENMSQTSLVHQGRRKKGDVWNFEDAPLEDFLLEGFKHYQYDTLMPKTAEKYGAMMEITRDECDSFSLLSHQRAKNAQLNQWNRFSEPKEGCDYLKGCFTVDTVDQKNESCYFWRDEGTRYDLSLKELQELRSIVKRNGLVTAGTASQISDGAACAVVMDREFADKHGFEYLAKIKGYNFGTVDPTIMGRGPVPAISGLLEKLNLKKSDIDLFEVNEAFAAQYLAVEKELGLPRDITNVNGGAVAMGHNIAATGLRITIDMIYELKKRGQKIGIGSACIGGGQGGAICVELV